MDTNETKIPTHKHALIIWFSLGVVFLTALFFASWNTANHANIADKTKPNEKTIMLTIDYGSSQQKWSGEFTGPVRVWDLLQQATELSGTALAATGNFIPHKIDGHQNNSKQGWHYYLNGTLQKTTPFDVFASAGDKVMFKWDVYNDAHPKKW